MMPLPETRILSRGAHSPHWGESVLSAVRPSYVATGLCVSVQAQVGVDNPNSRPLPASLDAPPSGRPGIHRNLIVPCGRYATVLLYVTDPIAVARPGIGACSDIRAGGRELSGRLSPRVVRVTRAKPDNRAGLSSWSLDDESATAQHHQVSPLTAGSLLHRLLERGSVFEVPTATHGRTLP